jgi:hypothetical protein
MEGHSEKERDRRYTQVTQRNLDRNHSQDSHTIRQDMNTLFPGGISGLYSS